MGGDVFEKLNKLVDKYKDIVELKELVINLRSGIDRLLDYNLLQRDEIDKLVGLLNGIIVDYINKRDVIGYKILVSLIINDSPVSLSTLKNEGHKIGSVIKYINDLKEDLRRIGIGLSLRIENWEPVPEFEDEERDERVMTSSKVDHCISLYRIVES